MPFWGDSAELICDLAEVVRLSTDSNGNIDVVKLCEELDDASYILIRKSRGTIVSKPDEGMNIVNQINAALQDIRTTLVSLTEFGKTPDISDRHRAVKMAYYQLDLTIMMIQDHRQKGVSIPWSERRHQVDEEFS